MGQIGYSQRLSRSVKHYDALPVPRILCHFETPDMHFAIIAKIFFVFGFTHGCPERPSTHKH